MISYNLIKYIYIIHENLYDICIGKFIRNSPAFKYGDFITLNKACYEDHFEVVALLTEHTSKEKIHSESGRSPLVSCFEDGGANYDSLEGSADSK